MTEKLRKNHGRDESWQLLIRLKMAGLVPAKKSASNGRYAIILPTGVNVTTAKEFDPLGREIPHSVPASLSPSFRNDSGPILVRSKFTACAYHVNIFADLFLAIAGVMRRFSLRSRQIKKIPIVR